MVNNIYNSTRVQLLTAQLDWRVIPLVLTAWSGIPDFDPLHEKINDILLDGHVELGRSMTIAHQAVAIDGTAQTDAVIIPNVPVGPDVTWFTMAWKNANYPLSPLILFIDEAEGLPFTPNGLDIEITPDWLENRGWWRP